MHTTKQTCHFLFAVGRWLTLLAIGSAAMAQTQGGVPEPPGGWSSTELIEPHMPVALRDAIDNVVVIAGQGPASENVTGSYERQTNGLIGGLDAGSQIGTISKEIGGVPVNIPIPGLAIPGAIFGAISGATKREIQEFRDALTEELVNAESPQLRSDGLAIDVFWALRKQPSLKSQLFSPNVEIPNDTDAIVYVNFNDVTIDIQGRDAVITASANVVVRRLRDGQNVYSTNLRYQDRDTLSRWTDNDNELWRQYTNFARYYLGREIAANLFGRVGLGHSMTPVATDSALKDRKDKRKLVSESTVPTLAWALSQEGEVKYPGWPATVADEDISYEIEIFDDRQLVYDAQQLPGSEHALTYELEDCKTYRWSVRPAYRVNGKVYFGDWLRYAPPAQKDSDEALPEIPGLVGRAASTAHAYTQDFPELEVECQRR